MYDVSMFAIKIGSHHRLFRVRVMHDASNFSRAYDVVSYKDHVNVDDSHLREYNAVP